MATHRESHTPWGKQTTLWEMHRGMVATSEEFVEPVFACLECLGCTEACGHGIEVAESLRSGRSRIFESGLLPRPLRRLLREHSSREAEVHRIVMNLPGYRKPASGTRVVLFAGCHAVLEETSMVGEAMRVLDGLSGGSTAVFSQMCCGLPLLQAGDVAGFVASARSLAEAVSGLRTLVILDPGCAYTMAKIYPRFGIEIEPDVVTIAEFVLPHLHRFVRRSNPPGPVFYHDPCQLGRGLGQYDQPREILLRLVVGGARELFTSREREPCCGGGGAIPVSMPAVAAATSSNLADLFTDQGARTVVTACPTCKTMLTGHGKLEVVDIVTLMARAL
jgi:Fe-S oxidoreductase